MKPTKRTYATPALQTMTPARADLLTHSEEEVYVEEEAYRGNRGEGNSYSWNKFFGNKKS